MLSGGNLVRNVKHNWLPVTLLAEKKNAGRHFALHSIRASFI